VLLPRTFKNLFDACWAATNVASSRWLQLTRFERTTRANLCKGFDFVIPAGGRFGRPAGTVDLDGKHMITRAVAEFAWSSLCMAMLGLSAAGCSESDAPNATEGTQPSSSPIGFARLAPTHFQEFVGDGFSLQVPSDAQVVEEDPTPASMASASEVPNTGVRIRGGGR
jgi:hypothetical protein